MLSDNRTIVIGLGKTGLSVARFLQREQQSFMLMDSGGNPPDRSFIETEFPNTPFITGRLDTALLKAADEIIVSPGISLQEPAIKEAAKIIEKDVDKLLIKLNSNFLCSQ